MSLLKSFKKNASVIMCITLLFSLFIVYPASASTFFQDRFEEGDNLWTSTSGNWTIVEDEGNSVYYQSATKEGRTSAGDPAWSDYTVEADVKVVDFNGSNRTYVAGRYIDGNNFYAASLYNNNDGMLEIRKKVSGSTTTLSSKPYALQTGVWYNVKLEMSGNTINMYVNDTLELSASDSKLKKVQQGSLPLRQLRCSTT